MTAPCSAKCVPRPRQNVVENTGDSAGRYTGRRVSNCCQNLQVPVEQCKHVSFQDKEEEEEKRREENENRERWRGRGREGENVSQNHHLGARCLFEVCALERRVRLNRSTHLEGLDDVQVGDLLELGVAGSVEVLLGDHDAVLEQLHVHLLAAGLGDPHL